MSSSFSSKKGPPRLVPEVVLSAVPTMISFQGCKISKTCKCGMPSNMALNVGAQQMFEKRIKIIGCWMTQYMIHPPELQRMWQGLPRNQKHIYYAQFLDRQNRAFAVRNPNTKEVSSLELNPQALEVMLNDLDRNSGNDVPKCRCILAMKFTEPLINYYIETNQSNPVRGILNSASPNSAPEVKILETKRAAAQGKPSKSILKRACPPEKAMTSVVQSPPLLQKYQEFIGSTARSVQETENFLEKLINCTVKVLPSPKKPITTMAKNPKILIKNVRSLAPKPGSSVSQSKVKPILPKPTKAKKDRPTSQDQVPDLQSVPTTWAWTLTPNSDIPVDKQEEIGYLALSMVQVVYEMETTETKKPKRVPAKKKPKTKTK